MTTIASVKQWATREAETYRQGEDRPMKGYLGAMGLYSTVVVGLTALARRRGVRPPERISPWDVALLGIATHRASRTLAKDAVASPIRAPFTTYGGLQASAELREQARTDTAARHTVGELLTCPFCLGQWVATAFCAGLVFAPRATRLTAATFASVAVSDCLQYGYAFLQKVES
jgi:Protein of unknown function (DUF1360)